MGSMFFLELIIGPARAVPMDIGGEYSGTVSGMTNMAGDIGGALSPTVFEYLVAGGSWVAPFKVAASLLFFGAAIWGVVVQSESDGSSRQVLRPCGAVSGRGYCFAGAGGGWAWTKGESD